MNVEMEEKDDRQLILEFITLLNKQPELGQEVDIETLEEVLRFSEVEYYNEIDEPEIILDDKVYDFLKDMVKDRKLLEAKKKGIQLVEESDMAHVPKPIGRMHDLPVWMGSASKMNHGDGQLRIWLDKYDGPFMISAKMDGASALYTGDKLYSRGEGNKGQDISEFMQYIPQKFPKLAKGEIIRGELIVKQSIFDAKYKRKERGDKSGFANSRNAVAGMVNKVGSNASKGVPTPFDDLRRRLIGDIDFIAYELITEPPLKASDQFARLVELFGENVARHELVDEINDDFLSDLYDTYLKEMDYEIDGLIVVSDHVYERPWGKNPDYMRAYKKQLDILTATTTIKYVEWRVGKKGNLNPRAWFDDIYIGGSWVEKASIYNASKVIEYGIGPGAVVEVTKAGGINPKIIKTIERAEPQFPDFEYEWDANRKFIRPVVHHDRTVETKKLYHFLDKMGTKGIGLKTVERMYDGGITTLPQLLSVTEEDLDFIGGKLASNIVKTIRENLKNLTLPLIAGASGVLGDLVGVTKAEYIWDTYPNIMVMDEIIDGDEEGQYKLLKTVEKFGEESAKSAAGGFEDLIVLLDELEEVGIKPVPYRPKPKTPQNSGTKGRAKAGTSSTTQNIIAPPKPGKKSIMGRVALLTGFRDGGIDAFINLNGGTVAKSLTKAVDLLIIKDSDYTNKKLETAIARGVEVITKDEFIAQYM